MTDSRPLTDAQKSIVAECDALRDLLLAKNRLYGNSALEPAGVFARGSALAQIAVRLDDKLNRIRNLGGLEAVLGAQAPDGEDTVRDLLGYLILARVAADAAGRKVPPPIPPSLLTPVQVVLHPDTQAPPAPVDLTPTVAWRGTMAPKDAAAAQRQVADDLARLVAEDPDSTL